MTETDTDLALYEALMLLALSEETGEMNGSYVNYTVAAALLAELLLLGRIEVDPEQKQAVVAIETSTTHSSLLDEALQAIAASPKPRTMRNWVEKIGVDEGLKHRVAEALADKGIVTLEEQKVLWLFTKKVYPEINPVPEQQLRQALRDAVFNTDLVPSESMIVLISLAKSAKLLPQVFSKAELAEQKARIDELVSGELVGEAAKGAIEAVEMAMIMTAILPAIAASTVTVN